MDIEGIVTRGDLPHWYKHGHAHFVTYRLYGSIPKSRLQRLTAQRNARIQTPEKFKIPRNHSREIAHKLFFGEYDRLLDTQPKHRFLEQPEIADVVRENLYHHNRTLYELLAWCVMPNHVHILIQPLERGLNLEWVEVVDIKPGCASLCSCETTDDKSPLSRVMHSLKSYTANQANKILGQTGKFWQRESYDHWVRDADELERIVDYIALNPVRAGLCKTPRDWIYSSAFERFQLDGSECAMVGKMRDDWR